MLFVVPNDPKLYSSINYALLICAAQEILQMTTTRTVACGMRATMMQRTVIVAMVATTTTTKMTTNRPTWTMTLLVVLNLKTHC